MFEDIKSEVALGNRILAASGLATGATASLGHISMRVPDAPDRFIVKGRGYDNDVIAKMQPDDMVVCDLEGYLVEGPPGCTQCFEVKMHSCIYKTHPDVQSVVHVHPRFVVLMSVINPDLKPMCQEGVQIVSKPLPYYPHTKTVVSDAEGMEVAELLGDSTAILLQGHGSATTGTTMQESFTTAYLLEEQARMNYYAYCADGANHRFIPDELVNEMSGRTPVWQEPHFIDSAKGSVRVPVGAVWQLYEEPARVGFNG